MKLDANVGSKPVVAALSVESQDSSKPVAVPSPIKGNNSEISKGGWKATPRTSPCRTMDWILIKRIATAQMIFSLIALLCISTVVFASTLSRSLMWYKTCMFLWALFLTITAYKGLTSDSKNYDKLVAYYVMSVVQTLVDAGWVMGVFLAVNYSVIVRPAEMTSDEIVQSEWIRNILIFMELMESFAILFTVLTGFYGVIVCNRGFARLLQHQDEAVMALPVH